MPQHIVECRGATYIRKRRGEIGDPCGVPTRTRARRLREPWKSRVQDPTPMPFGCFFFQVLCIINYGEQRPHGALAMAKKKPHPLSFIHPGTREKATNPSPSGMRPTAHQPRKIRNPPPTKRSKRKIQINTWGGINRKTVDIRHRGTVIQGLSVTEECGRGEIARAA